MAAGSVLVVAVERIQAAEAQRRLGTLGIQLVCLGILRAKFLAALKAMPMAPVATHEEALTFLERHGLTGRGIGWVDVHLFASTALVGGARVWTRDKRLGAIATNPGFSQAPSPYSGPE